MVCPAANMTPTIVRQANRQREYAEKHGLIRENGWPTPKNTLTPAEERREVRNCLIVVGVFLLLAGIAVFGPSLVY